MMSEETVENPILSPERVCSVLRHDVRSLIQVLNVAALRLQRMPPGTDILQAVQIVSDLVGKGAAMLDRMDKVFLENIGMAKTPPLRVVVVEDDPAIREYITQVVEEQHHDVVGTAGSGPEMVTTILAQKPDLAIFDIHLPGFDGLTAHSKAIGTHVFASVVITGDEDIDLVERATRNNLIGSYNLKPISKAQLVAAMKVAWARFREFNELSRSLAQSHSETQQVKQQLEARKILERAKGLLMDRYRWNEGTAFKAIQKAAKDKNLTLVEVADAVIKGRNIIPVEAK